AARQARKLRPEQRENIVRLLTPAEKGRVIVKPNFMDMEATPYANQITSALKEAGYQEVGDAPLSIVSVGEPGIVVVIQNADRLPKHLGPLVAALTSASIEVKLFSEPWVPDEETVVI